MTAHQPHWTLSATMAGRTVSTQGESPDKSVSSEQLPAGDRQNQSILARDLNRGVQEKWFPLGCPVRDTPTHWHSCRAELMEKVSPTNPHIPSPVFPHILTRQQPTTPEVHKMCLRFKVDNNKKSD